MSPNMKTREQLFIPHPEEDAEKYGKQLKRTVQEYLHLLKEHGEQMPDGFRYEVIVQPMPTNDGSSLVRQRLGMLSVSGVDSDNIDFDFHSISKGHDFFVRVGKEVDFHGANPKTVSDALSILLSTLPNRGQDNQEGFYLASIFNSKFYDRNGKYINPTEQLPNSFAKQLPTANE